MKRKLKISIGKLMFIVIIVFIVICFGIHFINKQIAKKNNIAESNHNTANDDRKLVNYSNFEILKMLSNSELEYTNLFSEFNKFIVRDLNKISSSDGSKEFYNNNRDIFFKKSYTLEVSEYEKLYNILKNQNIDFLNDFNSCKFEKNNDKSVKFEIIYENSFEIHGIIEKEESNSIYLRFI